MFCRLRKQAQLVENQACSLSGLHKTTLVWLTLWYSKSDSRHPSGKLVLTKCLRQAGMGLANQGLVSQQDKRQPSFPCLRDCPFQTTAHCELLTCLQGQTACFFRAGQSHCTWDRGVSPQGIHAKSQRKSSMQDWEGRDWAWQQNTPQGTVPWTPICGSILSFPDKQERIP